jgi:cytoskeletal protein CcmA (bactofilin family)
MFSRGSKASGLTRSGAQFSFIGPEVSIHGDIVTTGQLHIDGKVTGDVRCGTLSQGESGEVHGNIIAEEARLAGLVDGAVEAGSLGLDSSARVTGDILYDTLMVAAGAEVEGRFRRRRSGEKPSLMARAETSAAEPAGLFAMAPTAIAAE